MAAKSGKRVALVTEGSYSSYRILAVFDRPEDAQDAVSKGFGNRVEMWPVEPPGTPSLYRHYECVILKEEPPLPFSPFRTHLNEADILGGYEFMLAPKKLSVREFKKRYVIKGSDLEQVKSERSRILKSLGRKP